MSSMIACGATEPAVSPEDATEASGASCAAQGTGDAEAARKVT